MQKQNYEVSSLSILIIIGNIDGMPDYETKF
jgi:hypothetical protein